MDKETKTGSWESWAKYLVSEVQRSGNLLTRLENDIKNNTSSVSKVENKIKLLSISSGRELLQKDIQGVNKDISTLKEKIKRLDTSNKEVTTNVNSITNLKNELKIVEGDVEELKDFKITIKVAFSITIGFFGTVLTLLGIYASAQKNDRI